MDTAASLGWLQAREDEYGAAVSPAQGLHRPPSGRPWGPPGSERELPTTVASLRTVPPPSPEGVPRSHSPSMLRLPS